ncbi:MAG: bifunctional folylpolyglutamate synthase/dihydrofolate synthase [Lachnospiraceae bacterium]|nr:bifunctional folylpolyglutamate synthase/dihydrofolate synthase [Lachnospiraceae bacterium]
MEYQDALDYITDAGKYAGTFGLDNIRNLLEELGNPQSKLRFIHVGGTNGKGSVSAYISTILAVSGYRVGRYISPTILSYQERIQTLEMKKGKLYEEEIEKTKICKWVDRIKKACSVLRKKGLSHPTPFEIETAMGFLEFFDRNCDIVVLEVGLGGRTDATNIVDTVICEVMTSISKDHVQFLGNSLEKITMEKAGILKRKVPIAAYDYKTQYQIQKKTDVISPILKQKALEQEAELNFADFGEIKVLKESLEGTDFNYKDILGIHCSLLGRFQVRNAALAIEVAKILDKIGWKIGIQEIKEGIQKTKWRGRFEILHKNPYYIVDGAHNEDGAKVLAESIDIYLKNKKLLFIVGVLADKDCKSILSYTGKYAEMIYTVTPDNERALPATKLAEEAKLHCHRVEVVDSVELAMKKAEEIENDYDAVVIFGSLYYLHKVYDYMDNKKEERDRIC